MQTFSLCGDKNWDGESNGYGYVYFNSDKASTVNNNTVALTNGTYTASPETAVAGKTAVSVAYTAKSYVAEGYAVTDNGNGTWTIGTPTPVADYVTLALTIDDNYAAAYPEKVAAARAMYEGKKYASLAEAQAAFASLFGWNGSGYGNPNNGPFKNAVASNGPTPVTKVTFDLYGTTECGTITLGNFSTSSLYLMSVDVVGHDGAKISGNANISANVAGGYDNHHTTGGKLFVTNIEFTAETDNIQCYASCANIGTTDKTVEPSELEIAGCTFHTQLYMYSHSNDDGKMTYNIHDNAFVGSGVSNQANALHAQTGVDMGPTAINFYNNIVSNYTRGININVSSANQTKTANVYGNTIYPGVGYSAVQLSTINVANVHDNMIYLNAGNAITLHENLYAGAEVNVANNTIAYADGASVGYIVYDDAQAGNKTDALARALTMTYTGNTVAGGISTTQGVKGSNVYGLRPYVYYVLNGIVAGVVTDVGATTNLFTTIDAAIAKADEVGVNEVLLLGNGAENTNSNWKAGEGNKLVRKTYVAQIGDDGEKFETLAEAVAAAQAGDTVTLLTDIALTSMVTIDKSVKIDGNDKTITVTKGDANNYAFYFIAETAAIDCEFKNATIVSTGYQVAIMGNCDYQSTLKVDNVDITCDGECIYANGFVTVNATGCEFRHEGVYAEGKDPVYYSAIIVGYSGTINLADCEIISFGNGVATFPSGGTVTMSDVNIDATAVANSANSGYAMWVRNEDYTSYPEYCTDSTIIFESGSVKGNFKVSDTYTGDDPNNRYDARTTVSGGLFSADPSAYVADGYAAVELTEGEEYDAGYRWAVGKVVASDLVPSAGATETEATYNFSVVVTNETGEIGTLATKQTVTVRVDDEHSIADITLNDFDISDVLASAVSAVGMGNENVTVDLRVSSAAVSGGKVTFEAHPEAVIKVGSAAPEVVTLTNDDLADGATFSLKFYTGESFAVGTLVKITHKSADYEDEVFIASVAEDTAGRYVPVTVSHFSTFEIEPFTPDAGMVAVNSNTGVQYESLAAAVAEVQDGQIITMLANSTEASEPVLALNGSVTLDLNGKTVTANGDIWVKTGSLTVVGTTGSAINSSGYAFYVSTQSIANNVATLTINSSDVAIHGDAYGVAVMSGGVVNLQAGSISSGHFAITGNGSNAADTTINITGGTVTCDGTAIYHPGPGTLTVGLSTCDGGEGHSHPVITGKTGIEMRAGTLNVYCGDITATAAEFAEQANGSGSTIAGAAVAVSQHSTDLPIGVNISGGTLNGIYGVYEKDLQNPETGADVVIAVTGGEISGTTSAIAITDIASTTENVGAAVSGGSFSSAVPEEYCADGYIPAAQDPETGTYTVKQGAYVAQNTTTGVKYENLMEAIDAAYNGGTVELLANVTVNRWHQNVWSVEDRDDLTYSGNRAVTGCNGLTINGNGHSLTINSIDSGTNGNQIFRGSRNLTVSNITINAASGVNGIGLKSGLISDVTFNMVGSNPAIYTSGSAGCEEGEHIEIRNCTFNTEAADSFAIYSCDPENGVDVGTVISGNTFNTRRSVALRSDMQFLNNTVNGAKGVTVAGGSTAVVSGNYFSETTTSRSINVYPSNATIENNVILGPIELENETYETAPDLSGNYWGGDAPADLPEGVVVNSYYTTYSGYDTPSQDGSLFTLSDPVVFVAKIGTTKYPTLAAAIAAAQDGDTVQLLTNITLTAGVEVVKAQGGTFVLDGAGYTITAASPLSNSKIIAVYIEGKASDASAMQLDVKNLTIESDGLKYGFVLDSMQVAMSNVVVRANGGTAFCANTHASVTIDDCTIANTGSHTESWRDTALAVSYMADVTVNSGTFTSENGWAAYIFTSGGTIDVKGGTFSGKVRSSADTVGENRGDATITISGGEFSNVELTTAHDSNLNATIAVSGGWFSAQVPAMACAEGFEPTGALADAPNAAVPYTVGYAGDIIYPIEGTAGVRIALAWATNNTSVVSEGAPVTAADVPNIITALGETGANNMPRWQSYVLGLNPADATAVLRLGATAKDETTVTITGAIDTTKFPSISNMTVTFRLAARNDDGTWTDIATGKATPSFDVSLDTVAGKVLTIFADIVTE